MPRQGEVFAGHILVFCGAYAVVNSGVGSCPAGRYLSECFDDGVEVFRPDLIVCEAHTINDWLLGKSPKEYEKSLTKLLQKMKRTARAVVLVTGFSPLGEQAAPFNQTPYHEFVELQGARLKVKACFSPTRTGKWPIFLLEGPRGSSKSCFLRTTGM